MDLNSDSEIKHSHYCDSQQVRPCMLERGIHAADGHIHASA